MNKSIESIRRIRTTLLKNINGLSTEQLNKIPDGFNNNIIWNLAHMVSAMQGICYGRAGLNVAIEDKYYTPYRPDTKPEGIVDAAEIEVIKQLFFSTLDQLETDYTNNLFVNYPVVITRYGVELTNIDDALNFLPFHEGLHIGAIIALKKLVI